MMHDDAEPREAHERRAQMLDAGVGDADLGARDGGEADERADFDVIGPDAMRRAAERAAAVDRELVRADAVDLRAERDEEMAEVLDVRLAGGVAKDRRARAPRRRRRARSRSPVTLGSSRKTSAPRSPSRRQIERCRSSSNDGAEPLEREKVRVDAPAADDVAARRRQLDLAAAREQRAGQQDRRANLPAELGIELRRSRTSSRGCAACCARSIRRSTPIDAISSTSVSTSRMRGTFVERDRMLGQQRRADDRQRGVLVAGGTDRAGELVSALDDELQCAHVRAVR